MTKEEKISILIENGWSPYEGGTWIKLSWIENRKPYDRMAMSLDDAFSAYAPVEPHPFDKYHQMALEESKNDRTRN